MHSILLQEVVVTANKPRVPEDIFETWSPRTFDYEETDRAGHSSFSFYTSDNSATVYTLTIEGITQDGELINKRITIDKR